MIEYLVEDLLCQDHWVQRRTVMDSCLPWLGPCPGHDLHVVGGEHLALHPRHHLRLVSAQTKPASFRSLEGDVLRVKKSLDQRSGQSMLNLILTTKLQTSKFWISSHL